MKPYTVLINCGGGPVLRVKVRAADEVQAVELGCAVFREGLIGGALSIDPATPFTVMVCASVDPECPACRGSGVIGLSDGSNRPCSLCSPGF